jgi:hypothetical protein
MEYYRLIREYFLGVINNQDADLKQKTEQLDRADWNKLSLFVNTSGLLPVFYRQVPKLNLPSDIESWFKFRYYRHLERNLLLAQEAWKVLEQFRQVDILAISLKGPILAKLLYNDVGLRQSPCDLDFLVKPQDMERAEQTLKNTEYVSLNEDTGGFLRSIKLKYSRQLHFSKPSKELGRVNIDLHCDIRGFFSDSFLEDFWQDIRETYLDGHLAFLPAKENLLLYLSLVSFSTFEFVELRYLYDIHRLITRFKKELDWETISEKAARLGFESYLWFALKLSQEFFNSQIPEERLNRLKPPYIKRKILSFWINRDNILLRKGKIASSYTWRYLTSNYLARRNLAYILKSIGKKIFLPMAEVAGFYGQSAPKKPYFLYLKRLLKPIYRFLH